jgi:predicted MFS family arabinose efflux permease
MTPNTSPLRARPEILRYIKLLFLIMAGGAIYPLLYLRQNFELTLLSTFGISLAELSVAYSILGMAFVFSYVPSGWLADRFSPRILLTFSVSMTGIIGLWYATLPSAFWISVIFGLWGCTTGLTFWAALIKGCSLLAPEHLQARYFGLLEGGRGLFEALLATIAVAWFAYAVSSLGTADEEAMVQVIYFYSVVCLVISVFLWLVLKEPDDSTKRAPLQAEEAAAGLRETLTDLWSLVTNIRVWLVALCILTGYQVFWATYSYSAFLQTQFGLDAVAVAALTTVRLWMRPVGAVIAGFIGDRYHPVRSLGVAIAFAGLSLLGLLVLPADSPYTLLYFAVATSSVLIYGVRGIYWASFNTTRVAPQRAGLAIGMVSMIGYTPDIYMPMLNTYLITTYGEAVGYQLYFGSVGVTAFFGAGAAFYLLHLSKDDEPLSSE